MKNLLLTAAVFLLLASCSERETGGSAAVPAVDVSFSSDVLMLRQPFKVKVTGLEPGSYATVDYGDGTSPASMSRNTETHIYTKPGKFEVRVSAGGVEKMTAVEVFPLLSLSEALISLRDGDRIWVMAHRANTSDKSIPENSVSAVNAAIAAGAEIVETDTHLTKDGHVIVCHDSSIDATTNGSGYIADMTLEQIRSYRLKNRRGILTDEPIPTLEEFLLACRGKVYVNLDYSPRTARTRQVMEVVDRLGMRDQVFMFCNISDKVDECFSIGKDVHALPWFTEYKSLSPCDGISFVQFTYSTSGGMEDVTPAFSAGCLLQANLLHALDSRIPECSVDEDQLDDLLSKYGHVGLRAIQTDAPKELLSALEKRDSR